MHQTGAVRLIVLVRAAAAGREGVHQKRARPFLSQWVGRLCGMSDTRAIRALASRQHSVIVRDQLGRLGLSPSQIHHLTVTGVLEPRGRNTFAIGGAASTIHLEALAAVSEAGPDAVLGSPSALAWWNLPGFTVDPISVLRPHGRGMRRDRSRRIHVTRNLPAHHVTEHQGVPVLTPARAVFDAAALVPLPRLERALEKAWARHLLDGPTIHAMLDELGVKGRPGISSMRQLLADRPVDYVPCESGLELRFAKLLAEDGQAPMDRQVDVGGAFWIGRVDFVDRAAKVIVEVQSLEHHGTAPERAADAARVAALEAAGWTVIEVTEHDLWFAPAEMLRRIRYARRVAGRPGR